jgi:hypothetical protein
MIGSHSVISKVFRAHDLESVKEIVNLYGSSY